MIILIVHVHVHCIVHAQGGTQSIHDRGGSDVLFWVENLHPQYFLGQEICHVFF